MGISELLTKSKEEDTKIVAVKLAPSLVSKIQKIRKDTGKTNTQVYSALLDVGLEAYTMAAKSKASNGNGETPKRRGRPPGSGKKKVATTKKKASKAKA